MVLGSISEVLHVNLIPAIVVVIASCGNQVVLISGLAERQALCELQHQKPATCRLTVRPNRPMCTVGRTTTTSAIINLTDSGVNNGHTSNKKADIALATASMKDRTPVRVSEGARNSILHAYQLIQHHCSRPDVCGWAFNLQRRVVLHPLLPQHNCLHQLWRPKGCLHSPGCGGPICRPQEQMDTLPGLKAGAVAAA